MLIIKNSTKFPQGTAVTLGNFDGVHIGHQKLLQSLVTKAKNSHVPSVVVIFEPQPGEFFNNNPVLLRLTRLREKIYFFKKLGIDAVLCLKFNSDLALLEPQEFIKNILINKLNCKYLLIGEDYHFGKNRSGNYKILQQFFGVAVEQFMPVYLDKQRISSTKIRESFLQHDLATAQQLLGRPLTLIGKVTAGSGIANSWQIPTANIKLSPKQIGLRGVYLVKLYYKNDFFAAVANIGFRPTLNINTKNDLLLEVHLLEFGGNLYGKLVKVELLKWLRPEKKFANKAELVAAIQTDVAQAKQFFNILPARERNE